MTRHASTRGGITAPPSPPTPNTARLRSWVPGTSNRPPDDGRKSRGEALRAYWVAPQGLIMLAATGLALAIRLYLLSRPGYLTGITEYDDGVYLGGAVSLLSGSLPYHDFAFVQPPGILLLMTPTALIAKASTVSTAMAAARLLTVGASAACVALTGALVRHRGPLVTLAACGILAVYPDDIMAAHTLLLEPWMNLLVLSGASLAFRAGRLAPPRSLLWAGVLFGLAGSVKYWAVLPAAVLLAVCLLAGGRARAVRFAGGAVAGFALPVLPFALTGLATFVRSTLLDQASRAGSAVPQSLRLAHLTGLADLLNDAGRLTVSGDAGSLFARGDVTAAATWATGPLPVLCGLVVAAVLGLGTAAWYLRMRSGDGPGPLAWYAAATLACTVAAVLSYSAFFYHYADFAAPWLAITAGYAGQALWPRGVPWSRRALWPRGVPWSRRAVWPREVPRAREAPRSRPALPPRRAPGSRGSVRALAAVAAAFIVVGGLQAWELSGLHATGARADAALIPPGACLVTDEISLAIAASRFTAGTDGCPDVLDSLATTLVTGNGVSVQGGAGTLPQVVATWKAILARARYVWLSGTSDRRIPWTPALTRWFDQTFRPLPLGPGETGEGQVYVRRG